MFGYRVGSVAYLTDVIGARLTGSPAMKEANDWTRERLRSWGLANAHLEPWGPFGLGWSFGLVAGSTLLAESLSAEVRPRAQGFSDLAMNLGAASAGALSGMVLAMVGFGGLNLFAALFTVPVFVLAIRALLSRDRP